jgi:hypothetical protein
MLNLRFWLHIMSCRFTIFEIPEYTYEEFEAISVRIIKKLPRNTILR